jgi:hypothetical protein
MSKQQKTILILIVIFALAGVAFVATRQQAEPDNQQGTEEPPVGNPFEAPSDLTSLLDSMPVPMRAVVEPDDYVTEETVDRFYAVGGTQEKAIAFFTAELPEEGWIIEQDIKTVTDPKTGEPRTSAIFIKNDYQIVVAAYPNTHNPERGTTRLQVTVGRR